jgi:hypothetical protein
MAKSVHKVSFLAMMMAANRPPEEAPWSRAISLRASVGGLKSASDDKNVSGDQAG